MTYLWKEFCSQRRSQTLPCISSCNLYVRRSVSFTLLDKQSCRCVSEKEVAGPLGAEKEVTLVQSAILKYPTSLLWLDHYDDDWRDNPTLTDAPSPPLRTQLSNSLFSSHVHFHPSTVTGSGRFPAQTATAHFTRSLHRKLGPTLSR